jgi:ribulose-phosphate 3-epimerase
MSNVLVAPSILASDWGHLHDEVTAVASDGADMMHLDVMDGSFVPPITFGYDFVRACRKATTLPLDVHLMIVQPERHIEAFAEAGADIITVHQEVSPHLHRTVQQIHATGKKAGVAINPSTPVSTLHDIVDQIDLLLIMSVNPGWGGQAFIEMAIEKISEAATLIKSTGKNIYLEVDGGITDVTAKKCVNAGANLLVSGSYIFKDKTQYQQRIASLR